MDLVVVGEFSVVTVVVDLSDVGVAGLAPLDELLQAAAASKPIPDARATKHLRPVIGNPMSSRLLGAP